MLAGLAVAATVFVARPAEAQCPIGWVGFGTSCYQLSAAALPWGAQAAQANVAGGYLVAIGSAAENEFVRATFVAPIGTAWIGFNDQANEGTFVWDNGEPVVYTNWSPGEPNQLGNEDGVQMYANGTWNDLNVGNQLWGVYELDITAVPEPATVGLTAAGLALMGMTAARRRRR